MDVREIQCECQMRELEAAGYGPDAYLKIITGHIGRIDHPPGAWTRIDGSPT